MWAQALSLVGKRGRVVMTAIPHPADTRVDMSLFDRTLYEKQLRGSLFGSSNPRRDIPRMLDLYHAGQLKLDELVTREYTLDQLNEGYADMHAGPVGVSAVHHATGGVKSFGRWRGRTRQEQ